MNECYHKLKDESEKQQLFEVNTDNKEKVYFWFDMSWGC